MSNRSTVFCERTRERERERERGEHWKATLGSLLRDSVERICFFSERIDYCLELNTTKKNTFNYYKFEEDFPTGPCVGKRDEEECRTGVFMTGVSLTLPIERYRCLQRLRTAEIALPGLGSVTQNESLSRLNDCNGGLKTKDREKTNTPKKKRISHCRPTREYLMVD